MSLKTMFKTKLSKLIISRAWFLCHMTHINITHTLFLAKWKTVVLSIPQIGKEIAEPFTRSVRYSLDLSINANAPSSHFPFFPFRFQKFPPSFIGYESRRLYFPWSASMQPPGEETSRRCACFDGENCCFHGDHDRSSDPNCQHCGKSDRLSSYSYSSPALDSILLTDSEKLRRIFIASAKGFAIGAGLKGGLALFSILARLRRRKVLTSLRWDSLNIKSSVFVLIILFYEFILPFYLIFI